MYATAAFILHNQEGSTVPCGTLLAIMWQLAGRGGYMYMYQCTYTDTYTGPSPFTDHLKLSQQYQSAIL